MINRRRFIETGSLASLGSIFSSLGFSRTKTVLKKNLGVQIHSVRPQLVNDFEGTLKKISTSKINNL